MKKIKLITITIFCLIASIFIGCSQSKNELYQKTDEFVQSLQTTYESYGIFS